MNPSERDAQAGAKSEAEGAMGRPGAGDDLPTIASLADLYAAAWRIEADAVERYRALADRMAAFGNAELVDVFRDLAQAESIHRDEIERMAGDLDVAAHARRIGGWEAHDSPETAPLDAAHPAMTPWHALKLALAGEERAHAYFKQVAATADDPQIRALASEFVEEEAEHVGLCRRLLAKYPAPAGER